MASFGASGGLLRDPAFESGNIPGPERPETSGYQPFSSKGFWPRMLNLDEETERRLINWLTDEINRAREEKGPLIDDWKQWQTDYWAKPASEVKNFPFQRAANIVVPVTAIAVEAVHARILNTIFAVEPFWSVRPRTSSWIEVAPRVEDWLQTHVEDRNSLSVFEFSSSSMMELIKLGTCVGKSGYEQDLRKTIRTTPDGGDEDIWFERRNGATLDFVPLANFLIRLSETDPQTSPWVGEEHSFTWVQLKRFALSGRMSNEAIEDVRHHWSASRITKSGEGQEYQSHVDELANQEPDWWEKFEIQEVWCAFDVDGDGVDEEIVIDFHIDSRSILSIRYNWYTDLHRPYRVAQYVPVEGRIYGIGVGKQNEQFQEEITTIHRQRLDNATLANMFNIVVKKTSGFGPKEPIWPGKMWLVDDPKDILPLNLSTAYPEMHANEQRVLSYSERRTGVNEVILGLPPEGTPGTATGDLARIAEGNKRFDLVLKNVRRFYSQIGLDIIANFQQFGNRQQHWLVLEEDGIWVEQVLEFPPELVSRGAIIDLTATNSITNQVTEQQNWMQLFQVSTAYYDKAIERAFQVAQATQDPTLFVQMAQAGLMAGNEAFKRLLSTFNVIGAEALLLGGDNLNGQQRPALPPGPDEGADQGVQGSVGPPGLAGLEAVLASLGSLSSEPGAGGGFQQ